MKLEFPNKIHKNSYEEMIKSWINIGEAPGTLCEGLKFNNFLEETKLYSQNSPTGVNSNLYFLVIGEKIVGAIDIRESLNGTERLKEIGGFIGYGIVPEFRKKGYATKILELGLIECRKLGLDKILITAKIDNIGSIKVIEKNGGVFERVSKCGEYNRYWINL